MNFDKSNISFSGLITELRDLHQTQSTGTLFVTTEQNRLAQIHLEEGEINFVSFRGVHGMEALFLLQEIKAVRLRFTEGALASFKNELPTTSDILRIFGNPNTSKTQVEVSPGVPVLSNSTDNGLSKNDKAVIEESLANFIGPIAGIVCSEHFKSVHDLETLLTVLAGEIPDPKKAQSFLQTVRQKLSGSH